MKILIVSTYDNRGGAAKTAYRFAEEFKRQGHEVCMYVRYMTLKNSFIMESNRNRKSNKINHFLDYLPGYVLSGFNKEIPFTMGLFGESLNSIIKEFKPDIINIHWTWKGFVSFSQICKISRKVPVVWTMHDCSPFLGGRFYPKIESRLVKILSDINNIFRTVSLRNADITFVSPSRFLLNEFNKTSLSKRFKSLVINNGLDEKIFMKKDKKDIKKRKGLDNKKYILFGAVNLVNDPVKGGNILKETILDLQGYLIKNNIGLISFGSQNPFDGLNIDKKIETRFFGFVYSDKDMSEIISLSDLVLVPSLYENYPFVVLEPLSCGVPVVAFDVGGIPEIVKHKENGYLAEVNNKEDFIMGIKFCLDNKLSLRSRSYSISEKAREYLSLFNK